MTQRRPYATRPLFIGAQPWTPERRAAWLGLLLLAGGAPFGGYVLLAGCGGSLNAAGDAGADAADAEGGGAGAGGDTSVVIDFDASDATPNYDSSSVLDGNGDDVTQFDGNACELLTCPGTCVTGRCLFVIAQGGAFDLVVHGSVVYWTSAGASPGTGSILSIASSPTSSMGGSDVYSATQNNPHGLAVSATNLYWANDSATVGAVLTVPLTTTSDAGGAGGRDAAADGGGDAGGAQAVKPLATGQASPTAVAIDAANLYWTTLGTGMEANGTVVKLPLAGGEAVTLASGRSAPSAMAVDSVNVYWVDTGVGDFGGAVLKVPIVGGAVTTLAPGQNSPGSIAVDSENVYWTQQGTGTNNSAVVKVPIAGGSSVATIAGQQGPLAGLTVDPSTLTLYWAVVGGNGGGAILSAPVGGNVVTTLVTGLDYPFDLATDATSLYWTDNVDGTVSKLTPK